MAKKKILLTGKLNETMKDLNAYLSRFFHVQISSEDPQVLFGMLKVVNPDLILVSLVGAYDIDTSIFVEFSDHYRETPVMTIGTEKEMRQFLKFYDDGQFTNLIRPVDSQQVFVAACERLEVNPTELMEAALEAEAEESGKKKILVVDDNAATLRGMKAMLEEEYDVSIAPSGMKAMTSMGKKRPDLILLDYEMPVCDGKQTLEMIRADEDLASIPVIFLTGVGDRAHIEAVLGLRPAGYMLKPAVKDKVVEAIEKALGN